MIFLLLLAFVHAVPSPPAPLSGFIVLDGACNHATEVTLTGAQSGPTSSDAFCTVPFASYSLTSNSFSFNFTWSFPASDPQEINALTLVLQWKKFTIVASTIIAGAGSFSIPITRQGASGYSFMGGMTMSSGLRTLIGYYPVNPNGVDAFWVNLVSNRSPGLPQGALAGRLRIQATRGAPPTDPTTSTVGQTTTSAPASTTTAQTATTLIAQIAQATTPALSIVLVPALMVLSLGLFL